MKKGEVWVVRGVVYVVTSVRPDGEPCLTKGGSTRLHAATLTAAPGGGVLGVM